MSDHKWTQREISPEEVLVVIREFGAPTTGEMKWSLHTDSSSIRKPLGLLMADNRVFPMPYKGGIVWMEVDGKRGRPSPGRVRLERGHLSPRKDAVRANAKKALAVRSSEDSNLYTPAQFIVKFRRLDELAEEKGWSEKKLERARAKLRARTQPIA